MSGATVYRRVALSSIIAAGFPIPSRSESDAVNCPGGRSSVPRPHRGPQCNRQAVVSEL